MTQTIFEILSAVQDQLPPTERRIADLILSAPVESLAYQAQELAERAGVSNSAVSRLVQRLGHADWAALRKAAAQTQSGSPVGLRTQRLPPGDRTIAHHLRVEAENLSRSLEAVHPLMLGAVASALATAAQVHVIGFRNSRVLAGYAHLQLSQFRDHVRLLPLAGQTMAESLAGVDAKDAVLIVGLRRRPANFIKMMELLFQSGAKLALMTDDHKDPLAPRVDWPFTVQVGGSGELDSYTGALSLLNLLMTRVLAASGGEAEARLQAVEAMHGRLADLEG